VLIPVHLEKIHYRQLPPRFMPCGTYETQLQNSMSETKQIELFNEPAQARVERQGSKEINISFKGRDRDLRMYLRYLEKH
jgi:hypothetical protein